MAKKVSKDKVDQLVALIKDLITVQLVIAGSGPNGVRGVLGSADNNKISAIKSAIKKIK